MRTATQIQAHLNSLLRSALIRPGMFGGELYLQTRLSDLAYCEGSEEALEAAMEMLRTRYLFTSRGISGWFEGRLPAIKDFDDEVASVWAWIAHRLGFLDLPDLLGPEHHIKTLDLSRTAESRDWTPKQVADAIGPPTIRIGGRHNWVDVYAPEDAEAPWIYFDFVGIWVARKPPTSWFLRNTRTATSHGPQDRILLTPRGREFVERED